MNVKIFWHQLYKKCSTFFSFEVFVKSRDNYKLDLYLKTNIFKLRFWIIQWTIVQMYTSPFRLNFHLNFCFITTQKISWMSSSYSTNCPPRIEFKVYINIKQSPHEKNYQCLAFYQTHWRYLIYNEQILFI